MDLTNIPLIEPISPDVELDGGYCYCVRCTTEIEPKHDICPHCNQVQDWSWLKGNKNE